MKVDRKALIACAAFLGAPGYTAATAAMQPPAQIDPVAVAPAMYRVVLENEHVRVVEYSIAPGQRDPWHTHPPRLSYFLSGGTVRLHLQEGAPIDITEETGVTRWGNAAPVHSAENIGTTTVRVLLVEVKSAH